MERLTEKVFGFVQLKACGNDFCKETCAEHDEEKSCKNCHIQKAFEKLAEYEDLEEQGLLLRLPCEVGGRLYRIDFLGFIISDTVHSIHIIRNAAYLEMNYWDKGISLSEVGKTVFLTKAETEQKLREMNNNEDNE